MANHRAELNYLDAIEELGADNATALPDAAKGATSRSASMLERLSTTMTQLEHRLVYRAI